MTQEQDDRMTGQEEQEEQEESTNQTDRRKVSRVPCYPLNRESRKSTGE